MPTAKSARLNVGDPNYRITNNNAIDVHVGRRVRMRRTEVLPGNWTVT